MRELRYLWLFCVILAVVLLLVLQSFFGWSWDPVTIGLILIAVVWIVFQWYRRYPPG